MQAEANKGMGRLKQLCAVWLVGSALTSACLVGSAQAQSGSPAASPLSVFADSNDDRPGTSVPPPESRSQNVRRGDLNSGSQPATIDSRDQNAADRASARMLSELPPDPPTEFQQLLQHSLGKSLPIYGASMFRNVPSTFAPLDRVPVTQDYRIGPGDELLVQVWGQVTMNSRLTVDRAGNVYIPQVGTLRVAGMSFEQLPSYLKTQMGRVFRNFDLNVNMGQLRSMQIFVLGQARRPGSYTISSLSTLVDALFATGGPSPQGSLRDVQLKRSGKIIVDFDLYNLLQRGDKSNDIALLPGDVIYIPSAGPQVAVAGSVNAPAIYELRTGADSVDDVIGLASGLSSVAASTKARVERVEAHTLRSVLEVSLDTQGSRVTLRGGDILEVTAVVDRYKNGVVLRGNVANPGQYVWSPGMRVGDLLPDKDSLITRDYWLQRSHLGQPALSFFPACPSGSVQDEETMACVATNASASAALGSKERKSNSVDKQNDDKAVDAKPQSGSNSSATAMVEQGAGRFKARNDIVLSEPDIDWSYAVIERQSAETLTTSLLPFNLGRLVLAGDSSQNLELQPGDVVTIFSKADIRVPQAQQTRLVYLEGEFLSSGVYSALPGETLQQLVQRAGGLSPDAYLFGSAFTRESTRRAQQERLNEYVDQIELQAATNAANSTGRAVASQDAEIAAASQSRSEAVISTLRQAKSSGRIVLNLRPESNTVTQLPQIPLEDGDRFVVPQMPSMVSVSGAVYNPNSFLYNPHHHLRNYLETAGGANRNADKGRAYVIRADGSVLSRQQVASSVRRDGFGSLAIYPGDTIVVPVDLNKGKTIRNVVDISQIVGQFGLAIAAARLVF